jgi:hypothetical protein
MSSVRSPPRTPSCDASGIVDPAALEVRADLEVARQPLPRDLRRLTAGRDSRSISTALRFERTERRPASFSCARTKSAVTTPSSAHCSAPSRRSTAFVRRA